MSTPFSQFVEVNEALAGTSSKLAKQRCLAEYFRCLEDDELHRAVRYCGGRPFAATDERTLNIGGSLLSSVIIELWQLDPQRYHEEVIRAGEIGLALITLIPKDSAPTQARLELRDLEHAFDDLAATGQVESKRTLLRGLLGRCQSGLEAAYLTKIILGDMRTGVQQGTLEAAVAQAFEQPLPEIRRAQLLMGNLDEVAVLAKKRALADAQFRLFHPIQFMLATPQETPADAVELLNQRAFYAEDKLDGIRAQIHKSGYRIAIYTRTMDRADDAFPDVIQSISRIPGEFLVDGEIVPWRDGCVLPFAHIQRRLGRKQLTPRLLRENPVMFIAFDILYHDGQLLMDLPLRERRAHLHALTPSPQLLPVTEPVHVTTEIQITEAFESARQRRNEGIVLKDPESAYTPGRRGQAWLKLKTHLPTFDCVVTAAEYGHGKRRNVLSDYTFAVWDRDPIDTNAMLLNIGKAYSGLTDAEIAQLTQLFLELSQQRFGHVHIVRPEIVLEIACDQIQRSNRHASGYALRFPRIKRIRWDKRPQDADRIERIAELYASLSNFAHHEANPVSAPPEPSLFDMLDEPRQRHSDGRQIPS